MFAQKVLGLSVASISEVSAVVAEQAVHMHSKPYLKICWDNVGRLTTNNHQLKQQTTTTTHTSNHAVKTTTSYQLRIN